MGRNRGSHGKIVVPSTSSGAVDQSGFALLRIIETVGRVMEFAPNQQSDIANTSGFESSPVAYVENSPGLNGAQLAFKMMYPKTTPAFGHRGLVTFASGYTAHMYAWSLAMQWEALDTTEFAATPIDDKEFESGDHSWAGSMTSVVSDTTVMVEPGVEGAATFRMNDETTVDNTLAGTIVTSGRAVSVNRQGGHQTVTQQFSGDGVLTGAGDNKLFDGAIGVMEMTELVLTYNTGKTETVDGFLSQLNINVTRGALIDVSGTITLSGAHSLV